MSIVTVLESVEPIAVLPELPATSEKSMLIATSPCASSSTTVCVAVHRLLPSHDTSVATTPAIDTAVSGARGSDAVNVTMMMDPAVAGSSSQLIMTGDSAGAIGSTANTDGPAHCPPIVLSTIGKIAVSSSGLYAKQAAASFSLQHPHVLLKSSPLLQSLS